MARERVANRQRGPAGHSEARPDSAAGLGRLLGPPGLGPGFAVCNSGIWMRQCFGPLCLWPTSCGSPVCQGCPGSGPPEATIHCNNPSLRGAQPAPPPCVGRPARSRRCGSEPPPPASHFQQEALGPGRASGKQECDLERQPAPVGRRERGHWAGPCHSLHEALVSSATREVSRA